MLLQIRATPFHFDKHDGFPNVIGERRAAAVFVGFTNPEFSSATDIETSLLTEGLKKTVEEDLRLTFFVARDVLLTPRNEFS